jgi:hypothetical protein
MTGGTIHWRAEEVEQIELILVEGLMICVCDEIMLQQQQVMSCVGNVEV